MGRSASVSERARVVLVAMAALFAPIVACRAFVDLDGLGGGAAPDGAAVDDVNVTPQPDVTTGDAQRQPEDLGDSASIIDASDDLPTFDVDASKPCPSTGGPMARIATATGGSFCVDETEV